jgi:hypothetical protein
MNSTSHHDRCSIPWHETRRATNSGIWDLFCRSSNRQSWTESKRIHLGAAAWLRGGRRGFRFQLAIGTGRFGFGTFEMVALHLTVRAQVASQAPRGRSGYGLSHPGERTHSDDRTRSVVINAPVSFENRDLIQRMRPHTATSKLIAITDAGVEFQLLNPFFEALLPAFESKADEIRVEPHESGVKSRVVTTVSSCHCLVRHPITPPLRFPGF